MLESDDGVAATPEHPLPIPFEGLDEVLRAWGGRGELLAALAAVQDPNDMHVDRSWRTEDIRRRAHRVLLARIETTLLAWPDSQRTWLEALPAEADRARFTSTVPRAGVSWRETRRRHGWPPSAFSGKANTRVADELMSRTFVWTVSRLRDVTADAAAMEPSAGRLVRGRIAAAVGLLEASPMVSAAPIQPEAGDIRSLVREGYPWTVLAPVAEELRIADRSLPHLAREILFPDPDLRPRLFHLAVLGMILRAATASNATTTSLGPLSGTRTGPSYRVVDRSHRSWDLWFEGGGAWSFYRKHSPYGRLVLALTGRPSALSPDIALVLPGERALLIECKYSAGTEYVARQGLTQAIAYAAEYRTALVPTVLGLVVAPSGVVGDSTYESMAVGKIGLAAPEAVGAVVQGLFNS